MEHRRRRPPLRTVGMDPDLRHFPTVPLLPELCRRRPATDRFGERERRRDRPHLGTAARDAAVILAALDTGQLALGTDDGHGDAAVRPSYGA